MSDRSPTDVDFLALDVPAWEDFDIDQVTDDSEDELVHARIRHCLSEAPAPLTVSRIESLTGLSQRRIEDVLEILTRERQVAVGESGDTLVFSIDAQNRPEFGGERIEDTEENRIYEVSAVSTPTTEECVKIIEKRRWGDEYEHTVGGVVISGAMLDQVFTMVNRMDERMVYARENPNND